MSVQISYKKQALFGLVLILCILSITEISMRVYDFYFPNCQFIESEVYDEKYHLNLNEKYVLIMKN